MSELAKLIRKRYGEALIGQHVMTAPMGSYPGGRAVITEIDPDPAAPEIVFTVLNLSWRNEDSADGEIGIFENEYVQIVDGSERQQILAEVITALESADGIGSNAEAVEVVKRLMRDG